MSNIHFTSNHNNFGQEPEFDEEVTETVQYTDPKTGATRTVTKTIIKGGNGGNKSSFPGFDDNDDFFNMGEKFPGGQKQTFIMTSNFKGNFGGDGFGDEDIMSKFNGMYGNMGNKPNQKVVSTHIDGVPNLFRMKKQNVNQFGFQDEDIPTYNTNNYGMGSKGNDQKKFDLETFRKDCLDAHNKKRKIHKVGDLTRNAELDKIAQNYADKLAQTNSFEHSSNTYKGDNLGENLFMQGGRAMTGDYPVESWYDEIKDYNFQNPRKRTGVVGHFTQLVWKGSNQVGIGCGVSSNGSYYVVTNYYPAGNWVGEEGKNVFPK